MLRAEAGAPQPSTDYAAHQASRICGKPFVADRSGALYWPAERHAAGRRPAPGEGLGVRRARRHAAALRHARDADAPRRGHRPLRAAHASSRSATACTTSSAARRIGPDELRDPAHPAGGPRVDLDGRQPRPRDRRRARRHASLGRFEVAGIDAAPRAARRARHARDRRPPAPRRQASPCTATRSAGPASSATAAAW